MSFLIITPSELTKGYSVLAGYPEEDHRDKVLEQMREDEPDKLFLAQNPEDRERAADDPRRTL